MRNGGTMNKQMSLSALVTLSLVVALAVALVWVAVLAASVVR